MHSVLWQNRYRPCQFYLASLFHSRKKVWFAFCCFLPLLIDFYFRLSCFATIDCKSSMSLGGRDSCSVPSRSSFCIPFCFFFFLFCFVFCCFFYPFLSTRVLYIFFTRLQSFASFVCFFFPSYKHAFFVLLSSCIECMLHIIISINVNTMFRFDKPLSAAKGRV